MTRASIGPASSSWTTRIMVTPVMGAGDHRAMNTARRRGMRKQRGMDVDHPEPRDHSSASGRIRRRRRPRPDRHQGRGSWRETRRRGASSGWSTGAPTGHQVLCRGRGHAVTPSPGPVGLLARATTLCRDLSSATSATATRASRDTRCAGEGRWRRGPLPSACPFQLVDFPDNHILLYAAQPVDEQQAVEAIHLAPKRPRKKVARLDRLFRS